MRTPSDREVTARAGHGPDPDGELEFGAFYRRNWLPMVRLAGLLVDDAGTAEDVVQDAFIAFGRRRDSIRSVDAELTYLRTCVVNGARSVLRRRALTRRYAHTQLEGQVEAAEASVLAGPDSSEMMAAVRRLPRRQREVLVLRYWHDLPHLDVARVLGISESTAKSTASRALSALEAMLEGDR